jgi:hypothetical protein
MMIRLLRHIISTQTEAQGHPGQPRAAGNTASFCQVKVLFLIARPCKVAAESAGADQLRNQHSAEPQSTQWLTTRIEAPDLLDVLNFEGGKCGSAANNLCLVLGFWISRIKITPEPP